MSAGNTATPPTAMQRENVAASSGGQHQRRATTTRSMPARSRRASAAANAGLARERRDRGGLALPQLDREQPDARARRACATSRADHVQAVVAGEQRDLRGSCARPRAAAASPVGDVRRVGEHGVERPVHRREQVAAARTRRRAPAARRWPARPPARPRSTSAATTSRSGRSSLSASATAPLPVPTSTTRAPCGQLERRPRRAARSPAAARARAGRPRSSRWRKPLRPTR